MPQAGDQGTLSSTQGAGGLLSSAGGESASGPASQEEEVAPCEPSVLCFSLLPADGGRRGKSPL